MEDKWMREEAEEEARQAAHAAAVMGLELRAVHDAAIRGSHGRPSARCSSRCSAWACAS